MFRELPDKAVRMHMVEAELRQMQDTLIQRSLSWSCTYVFCSWQETSGFKRPALHFKLMLYMFCSETLLLFTAGRNRFCISMVVPH